MMWIKASFASLLLVALLDSTVAAPSQGLGTVLLLGRITAALLQFVLHTLLAVVALPKCVIGALQVAAHLAHFQ